MGTVKISKEEYKKLFEALTTRAYEKMMVGYDIYGDEMGPEFHFLEEIEDELGDTINYLIMGLFRARELKKRMEDKYAVVL